MAEPGTRTALIERLVQLSIDPATRAFVRVALIVRLSDQQMSEVIQEVLEAVERLERNSGRFPSVVQDGGDEDIPE